MKNTCRISESFFKKKDHNAEKLGSVCPGREEVSCFLVEGNGRELPWLRPESIDCIITDHPWLDVLSNQGGNRSFADYDCFRYEPGDFMEKARVLKPGCFLAEIVPAENESNYEYLYQMKRMAKEAGLLYYCKVPWKKGKFVSNTGRKAKNTQDIMIFTKGKARNLRLDVKRSRQTGEPQFMSGTKGMLPAMFDVEPVPRHLKVNQGELPVELCRGLMEYLTLEGEIVLDQFAGSGAVGVAALDCGRNCILVEKEAENADTIRERFRNWRIGGGMAS